MSKLILHVDDEPDIRDLLKAALADCGHRVLSAGSTLEAMKAVAAQVPDLIIADMQLGDGDGLEFVEQVRALGHKPKVIMLTGVLIDPRVAQKSLGHAVDLYLPKTATLREIMGEIERLLAA